LVPYGEEEEVRPSDRYVLIKVLPDGTPTSVRPVPSLEAAREELKLLRAKEAGWHIFDLQEDKPMEDEAGAAGPS
jgi:hypothetical protein